MSVQLLDKTRKINKLLHNNDSSKVVFNDICDVLTDILDSNVLVVSKKGKVLGGSKCADVPYIEELIEKEGYDSTIIFILTDMGGHEQLDAKTGCEVDVLENIMSVK